MVLFIGVKLHHVNLTEVWSCLECAKEVDNTSSIKCSKCLLYICFTCNEGGVTKYFKKTPKNFKCYICKGQ